MKSANDYVQPSMLDAVAELAALLRRALRELDDIALGDAGGRRDKMDSMTSSRICGLD